ncbi:MAG: hypothetical protein Q8N04_04285 [Nitrospira sp.]|nr:hypothetical protein [Nitrospira sp.]
MANWHVRIRLHENMINTALAAIEKQRPSLFNYATQRLAKRNDACNTVVHLANNASTFTVIDPLVVGQDKRQRLLAEYSYQIKNLRMDFSPLADEGPEHFRMTADLAVGLGAPDTLLEADLLLPNDDPGPPLDNYIDYVGLSCYRSSFEAAGVARFIRHRGQYALLLQLTTFTLGSSVGIYAMVEHYLRTTINAVILPQAAMVIEPFAIDAPDGREPDIEIGLSPADGANPSFAGNFLELRLLTS